MDPMTAKKKTHEITWDELETSVCEWGSDSLFPSTDSERDSRCGDNAEYVLSSLGMAWNLCEAHFSQIDEFLSDLGIDIHD